MRFFFKQKTAYELRISDWSSDVCSSGPADGLSAHQRVEDAGCRAHRGLDGGAAVLLAAGEVARQQDVERIGGLEQQLAADGVVVLFVVLVVGARAVSGAPVPPAVALALGGVEDRKRGV